MLNQKNILFELSKMDKNMYNLTIALDSLQANPIQMLGKDLRIEYGFHPSPFGECFIATTPHGICALEFVDDDRENILQQFVLRWKSENISQIQDKTRELIQNVFQSQNRLQLLLSGTEFQLRVWKVLCGIPFGKVVTYMQIASIIGMPGASRAVGSAIAKNNIAYLVPCHRVIQGSGRMGGFKWKIERKRAILEYEKIHSYPLQTQMVFSQELDLRS
jgi:AraC family transcriptional regulator, regulatory protein of adaptative response / methylated-DNA-[protein]-cysteine methyltransferase